MQASDQSGLGKPCLRVLETQLIQEPGSEGILLLDPEGLFEDPVFVPQGLLPVVASFTGQWTLNEIAERLGREFGQEVPLHFVQQVAQDLEKRLCLEGEPVEEARRVRLADFASLTSRPAFHAGSNGYPEAPEECERALRELLGEPRSPLGDARLIGLIAPHIDIQRGRDGYREAYSSLRQHPPSDLYIVFGTSHNGASQSLIPFRKAYDTPLGLVPTDRDFVEHFLEESGEAGGLQTSLDEEILHLREHSVEFQVLFLKQVLGDHPFAIVPFLTGPLPDRPEEDAAIQHQLDVLERLVRAYPGRVSFVGGADMSHLGPWFGDPEPVDAELLGNLDSLDRGSLDLLLQGRIGDFHTHVHEHDNPRRICGGPPMFYTAELSRRMDPTCSIDLLHYGQAVAEDGNQVVSHASVLFHGKA